MIQIECSTKVWGPWPPVLKRCSACGESLPYALIAQLNLRAFAVLAQAMADEPADRPDTLDETA